MERRVLRGSRPEPDVSEPGSVGVTVVGRHWFGQIDPSLGVQARSLAVAARVDLLEVCFSGYEAGSCLESINLWPDLARADVADAALQYLRGEPRPLAEQ